MALCWLSFPAGSASSFWGLPGTVDACDAVSSWSLAAWLARVDLEGVVTGRLVGKAGFGSNASDFVVIAIVGERVGTACVAFGSAFTKLGGGTGGLAIVGFGTAWCSCLVCRGGAGGIAFGE